MTEYPTADDVHTLHETVVAENADTDAGVRTPAAVESALVYVSEGYFGEVPETIHEKAAHLARLLASEHPYVDGNKRTALSAATMFTTSMGTSSRRRTPRFAVSSDSSPPTNRRPTWTPWWRSSKRTRTPKPMTAQHTNESMSEVTDDRAERERLVERIRTAETPEERREAVQALAKRNINRQRETYEKLAHE